MIKVAVTGASGKMGKLILSNILRFEDLKLSAAFDLVNIGMDVGEVAQLGTLNVPISDIKDLESVLKSSGTDVLIDFTIAQATIVNAPRAAACGVSLVIGTTGLSDEQKATINDAILKNNVAGIISPNYSVGVSVFFRILKEAAKYLGEMDVEIIEAHHNQKKDAPSGTALKAADVISEVLGGREYVYGREGIAPRGREIGIHAVRGGDIVGDHTVLFAGDGERIEIKHQAHSRQAFAGGAVKAALWIGSAKPGVYTMEDILGL
ncbi:4-hydroxy-tetrahydrodipicolinate reductase [Methanolobus chelungpuianus]|uniref:4-hydroxy-tetrahydrodipicolinate reductase n=1 Tax=Methanolobus chelungpuianus TaxID=502115 RepID=A0AAE3KVH7_9EURY|nr:4-hydroxy-tetrahydrodipicolinate reductase [Methanolobus chelungpuianus]MCQ6961850.1 dihydrodipicolinate reductase [Methanolobus chelungpuianus]